MEINSPSPFVVQEIRSALEKNDGNIGKVFRAIESGKSLNGELIAEGAVANSGAAGNMKAVLSSILSRKLPLYPSRASMAGRSIGGLIRENPSFSDETRLYLQRLREDLDSVVNNEQAQHLEQSEFEASSEDLVADVERKGGVYVYTFKTYYSNPVKSDPERFWFKIGMTERVVDLRIADQTRSTAMPEDPWVLRVYRSESKSNAEIEKLFHSMLEAAGHSRTDARHGGKEWFATNLEFLDGLAQIMNLEIEQGQIINS